MKHGEIIYVFTKNAAMMGAMQSMKPSKQLDKLITL